MMEIQFVLIFYFITVVGVERVRFLRNRRLLKFFIEFSVYFGVFELKQTRRKSFITCG